MDITLRIIPCESKLKHPTAWKQNRIIAANHFDLRFHNNRFEIKANPKATNPLLLTKIDNVHVRHTSFQIGTRWIELPKESRLSIGNADILPLQLIILFDNQGNATALHMLRLNNAQHIEYVFSAKATVAFLIENNQISVTDEGGDFQINLSAHDNISFTHKNAMSDIILAECIKKGSLPFSLPIKDKNACIREAKIDDFRTI